MTSNDQNSRERPETGGVEPCPPAAGRSMGALMGSAGLSTHWAVLRVSAGLSLAGAAVLAPVDWRSALLFGVPALWTTAFLGTSIVTLGLVGPSSGADSASRKSALVRALIAKAFLFLAGACFVAWGTKAMFALARERGPVQAALACLPMFAGLHVLPAAALLCMAFKRAEADSRERRPAAGTVPGPRGGMKQEMKRGLQG